MGLPLHMYIFTCRKYMCIYFVIMRVKNEIQYLQLIKCTGVPLSQTRCHTKPIKLLLLKAWSIEIMTTRLKLMPKLRWDACTCRLTNYVKTIDWKQIFLFQCEFSWSYGLRLISKIALPIFGQVVTLNFSLWASNFKKNV